MPTDDDLKQAELQRKIDEEQQKSAEAKQKAIEAAQKAAEAEQKRVEAELNTAAAAEAAERTARQADADTAKAIAEAEKATIEAKKVVADTERALADADLQAERDQRKADAELRKTVAEADSAAIKAYLPDVSTLKPLEGTVTADAKAGILGETAALVLVGASLEAAFSRWRPTSPMRILVVPDRALVKTDWSHRSVVIQTERLTADATTIDNALATELAPATGSGHDDDRNRVDEGDDLVETKTLAMTRLLGALSPAAAIAGSLPAIVGTAADVAGYFQSNYTLAGRDVEASDEHVVALAVGCVRARATETNAIAVAVDGFHTIPESPVLTAYSALIERRLSIVRRRIELERRNIPAAAEALARSKAELERAETLLKRAEDRQQPSDDEIENRTADRTSARASTDAKQAAHDRLVALVEQAKDLVTVIDTFSTSVLASPADGSLPQLAQAAIRELLHHTTDVDRRFTHILHVAVPSLVGESQTRQRRFRAPIMRYVGSCTVSVVMAATDGDVVFADSRTMVGQIEFSLKSGAVGRFKVVALA